jgi:hypothetical protein
MVKTLSALAGCVAAAIISAAALAAPTTLTFDDIGSLTEYDALYGVTFSSNIALWNGSGFASVQSDPSGGAFSLPFAICVGLCGGQGPGDISFATDQTTVSIVALSGPGSENLTAGMKIEALDSIGNVLATDVVDTSLQFDTLTVSASGIRGLRLTSLVVNNDAWDQLVIDDTPLAAAAPAATILYWLGLELMGRRRR